MKKRKDSSEDKESDRGAVCMKDSKRVVQFFSADFKGAMRVIDSNKIKTDWRGDSKSMELKGRVV